MSRSDRILVAAGGGALVLVAVAGWMLLAPSIATPPPSLEGSLFVSSSGAPTPAASGAGGTDPIVVDVQGGVAEPGIRELPAGSRVADAIDAAGGYGVDADLEAAASLNLAEPLADGQQVRVPRIGDGVVAAAPSVPAGGGGGSGGGPINLNTATPEELEALPGIGPVTVQKIVAARTERPFASLEDAVTRGVINRGQLEDIQGVATAG
ncbi:MAG TPA: helix-hairpin-helix domain-containing protein [Candidatus Limnocylindria bacterium]